MSKVQRNLTIALWALMVVMMITLVAARVWQRPRAGEELPALFRVADFALTDQHDRPFGTEQLRGKVWVADAMFTHCPSACPLMTRAMADLQAKLPREVHFASLTVDPERDTPERLKAFADGYGADHSRWHFLTGPGDAPVRAVQGSLKLAAKPHSEKFLLVDRNLDVRGIYDSNDGEEMKRLAADANRVLKEPAK